MTMENVYYDPEAFGLEIVETVDLSESYEFDMFIVWQRAGVRTDEYLWASDAGCSCPTPFESEDMLTLEHGPLDRLTTAYREWRDSRRSYGLHPPATLEIAVQG